MRIIEHQAHAPGHAALLIADRGVLVAGDMLSDVEIPLFDLTGTVDPVTDYLQALGEFEDVADDFDVVVPGHGMVGDRTQLRQRIDHDRAYCLVLRDGRRPDDARVGPSASYGRDWLPGEHERQLRHLLGNDS